MPLEPGGSRNRADDSSNGRVSIVTPHPGGPGGRCESDSSQSLGASSDGGSKLAVVVPEAARFAALKSATLKQQLVRSCSMLAIAV